ncbi:hypothetical protein B0A69_16755 [Chryseobacterium shigense]|uniref:Uncharacterized protein n=1 Tax=Chryseobacterium shigense TaxID=297244 RepID=A0A1N7IEK4_9FLAO|nr:hypothetical protein [Chryseobacterium shigense]PQA91466.1 hypothetical protein B0A69_16755 [Chryseobacterium shigense]SIS35460.1 hypothetical protein SAMN05421639_103296 [Chryseobacterium shigense]
MKNTILFLAMIASGFIYSQVGINTTNPRGIFHVDGSKDNPTTGAPSAVQGSNDFTVISDGSVGIGTSTPAASAILDINVDGLAVGSKKGMLGPKAALTSYVDQATIPSPAAGLLVYNLGTGGLVYVGYVFWNGTEWRTFDNKSLAPGTLSSLDCANATFSPSTYTAGSPYSGTLTVPYTGGNGGVYSAQTITVNGLTATVTSGNFAVGSGTLIYSVSGTPTVSSPTTTTFPINVGGQTCSAVVGAGSTIAQGELTYYHKSIPRKTASFLLSQFLTDLPVIDGTFRIDAFVTAPNAFDSGSTGSTNFDPRLYNISSSAAKLWVSEVSTYTGDHAANRLLGPGNYAQFDDGVFLSQGSNETVTVDITTTDNKWYRVYYILRIDNKSMTGTPVNGRDRTPTTDSNTLDNTLEVYISIQRLY